MANSATALSRTGRCQCSCLASSKRSHQSIVRVSDLVSHGLPSRFALLLACLVGPSACGGAQADETLAAMTTAFEAGDCEAVDSLRPPGGTVPDSHWNVAAGYVDTSSGFRGAVQALDRGDDFYALEGLGTMIESYVQPPPYWLQDAYWNALARISDDTGDRGFRYMNHLVWKICIGASSAHLLPVSAERSGRYFWLTPMIDDLSLPRDLKAATLGDLGYVICAGRGDRRYLVNCGIYTFGTVDIYEQDWHLRVLDVHSGAVVSERTFTTTRPECPQTITMDLTTSREEIAGPLNERAVARWLRRVIQ